MSTKFGTTRRNSTRTKLCRTSCGSTSRSRSSAGRSREKQRQHKEEQTQHEHEQEKPQHKDLSEHKIRHDTTEQHSKAEHKNRVRETSLFFLSQPVRNSPGPTRLSKTLPQARASAGKVGKSLPANTNAQHNILRKLPNFRPRCHLHLLGMSVGMSKSGHFGFWACLGMSGACVHP